ncbi:hypothetical protein TRFO_21291 [Tritrichomonas foetus]|uniref:Uncharacterized protein n=1 Tax=Tritrichomonas foetus TaxID=1144522 RepID=A0A1J4KER1_9EUKA|nr:hypothetical protein TRFO_21291 [Tritrichomonas foetus]|eukprot:OHT09683.1 hypothetical protein TRFO_21291 [Tritrichomonas foetus]
MGKDEKIKEFIEVLKPGKKLNSWGAQIDSLEIAENGRDPLNHQINTENFNNINWRTDIVYYI